jgi:molecular chaperone DnaK (HSP70)
MSTQWAVDFGTTNTVVAVAEEGNVRVVPLTGLGREQPTSQSVLIPSAIHVQETRERWLWFFSRPGLEVRIGQQALNRNYDGRSPAFDQSFKLHLGSQPHRPAVRLKTAPLTVREVTRLFLRELLAAIEAQSGRPARELTIPAPVGFYEAYRAELQTLVRHLGVRSFRSLDEPIAAALGYGVNVTREETLLVVDFGGGTLNLAAIRLGPQTIETGAATVLAKHMVRLGGNDVDRWLVEHLVPPGLRELPEWQYDLRWEAMWVKERVSREGEAEFQWGGLRKPFDRAAFVRLLGERGLYEQVRVALDEIRRQLATVPDPAVKGVEEVLLCGGSTLLPDVAAVVDDAFPEAVVRHDPDYVFTSVALGAARFAGGVPLDDFIYHDYALAVRNEQTGAVEYELVVPRGTRYPTPADFAVRYYADFPGMTEMRFSICEVGRLGQAPVAWQPRPTGSRQWVPRDEQERGLVVELNPADEPLPLRPAGEGSSPRLRVTYAVNTDRWLCTTVEDLVRKQQLRVDEPVVRLR